MFFEENNSETQIIYDISKKKVDLKNFRCFLIKLFCFYLKKIKLLNSLHIYGTTVKELNKKKLKE